MSTWYESAAPGEHCTADTRCPDAEPDGNCETCDSIDGRWIEAVADYASTCDGCHELTMHELMAMDPKTQLGYCPDCRDEARADGRLLDQ